MLFHCVDDMVNVDYRMLDNQMVNIVMVIQIFLRKKSSLIKNGQMFFLLGTHLIPDLLTRLFDNVVVVVCVTHTHT